MHLRDWKVTSPSLADGGHALYLHYLSLRYTPPTWRAYLTLFSCHRPPHWAGPRKTLRNCPAVQWTPKSENRVNERGRNLSGEIGIRDWVADNVCDLSIVYSTQIIRVHGVLLTSITRSTMMISVAVGVQVRRFYDLLPQNVRCRPSTRSGFDLVYAIPYLALRPSVPPSLPPKSHFCANCSLQRYKCIEESIYISINRSQFAHSSFDLCPMQ